MNGFEKTIAKYNGKGLHSLDIETIQVNIGLKCNLECVHCHVVSSPRRKEMMDWETMEHVIAAAEKTNAKLVDITGGAPEMHPQFRQFVKIVREKGFPVMVRTNLTILLQPGFESFPLSFRSKRSNFVRLCPATLRKTLTRNAAQAFLKKVSKHYNASTVTGMESNPIFP